MHVKKTWLFYLILAVGTAGCSGSAGFDLNKPARNTISPPSKWKITCPEGDFTNIGNAIDGSSRTMAISKANYNGASFTIDLGRICNFNMIVILHGSKERNFPKKIVVSTSVDGKQFMNVHTAPGTRKYTYLALLTPVNARYLRLTAVAQGAKPWAISGVYLQ
jgi:hypothetical protein